MSNEHPCQGCGVMVPESEALGRVYENGRSDEYLCPDCYAMGPLNAWLAFEVDMGDHEWETIYVHESVVGFKAERDGRRVRAPAPDCAVFKPHCFWPSVRSTYIADMFIDVNRVYRLVDEGFIQERQAHLLFKPRGGFQ